jgi:hypothetical protein
MPYARESPRAKAERAVPGPDGAVLDSLEELITRTRAVARSLPDITDVDGPGQDRASFGKDPPRYCGTSPVPPASLPTCDLPRPALR